MSTRNKWNLMATPEDQDVSWHRVNRTKSAQATRAVLATFHQNSHFRDADIMERLTRKSARRTA